MEVLHEQSEHGVVERRFDMTVGEEAVPGILWTPERATGSRPTVLIGHGGTLHKRTPTVLGLARRFVRHLGCAAVALDAPGHGERIVDKDAAERARRELQSRIRAARESGRPATGEISPELAAERRDRTRRGVAEWRALVDSLASVDGLGDGPFGYWGLSMGTAIGLPFVASEPRVKAAVLGLAGLEGRVDRAGFEQAARSLTIPVLFILQWDDEIVPRDAGLALFDAIGSSEKTLHLNPGGHVGTPLFERESYDAFFARHLGRASA